MRAAWRAADVRAAEKTLMATLPPGTLMARAAAGLARRCAITLRARGRVYGSRVLLLVGTGDNGGDALYAGATLAGQGAAVSAWLTDARRAHVGGLETFLARGGRVVTEWPSDVDLVVDGMLGIGASGALRGAALDAANRLAGLNAPVIAVDVPSGVAVDTGDLPGPAVRADVTVTFGVLKPALVVGPAAPLAGQVELVDIGLTMTAAPAVRLAEQADIEEWWPHAGAESDKYSRGVVGLATGSASFPGAALLSTAGALAGPTGMVRYAGPAHSIVATLHPSVVVAPRVADAGRVQAWVCGSGLSTDQRAREELRAVLAAPVPAVLDADAITMLVDGTHANELRARSAPTVLTPHDGEFKRLAGSAPGEDRVGAALTLAAWTRSVVLLKGDRTIIACPDGEAWVNPTGTPALATAGSGDVLGGLLGALLAGGLTPVRAAVAAAYLHGLAGRAAAETGSVTSADVALALRTVVPH
ncbi:MAG: NAD(P)H-hydrate dehydratase [Hamadaea sp.]|nr:NAD(P)H-hydrate dehydratase [Hamadaea sp.]NUT03209.1 NAD(P)H-hydrate dehydratase [Hamadaea sp.]